MHRCLRLSLCSSSDIGGVRFFVHLVSSAVTPAGSVRTSRCDNVVCGNVRCVAAVVKDSVFKPWSVEVCCMFVLGVLCMLCFLFV